MLLYLTSRRALSCDACTRVICVTRMLLGYHSGCSSTLRLRRSLLQKLQQKLLTALLHLTSRCAPKLEYEGFFQA